MSLAKRGWLLIVGLVILGCGQTPPTSDIASVPTWAKQAVWYQIFPERFRNGDPTNDPQLDDIIGSWPHDASMPYQVSSWTGDWYALQPWESPEKSLNYHIQRRRYGGDLQGVLDKLDYLQDLGITAIYFNPLFEAPSMHKYDGASFHHIDDNFGPNPPRDREIVASEAPNQPETWKWTTADSLFLDLVAECHRRGMRVIIDGVFNHVGLNFWAFRDVVAKQQKSEFKDWFTINKWDDPATPENEFDFEGWNGVKELPEICENENGLIPEARDYVFHSVKRWMDPNNDGDPSDGIDGWRLDVAEKVSPAFWRQFRKHVRAINPDAYLVGEVWWEDWRNDKMFNARPWLEGDVFDAVMNYRVAAEMMHFFADKKNKISASEFGRRLDSLRADYREPVNYGLMNLLDSHDTDRLASQVINYDDVYDHRDIPHDNPNYEIRKPNADEIAIQKLIVIFQMTYVGAPSIYYGGEAGMWGSDDPDCRKPMVWPDIVFENEARHPFNKPRPADENRFNQDIFDHYKTLIGIRNAHPVLQTGSFETVLADDAADVFVFKRSTDAQLLIVVINNSADRQTVTLDANKIGSRTGYKDLISQQTFQTDGQNLMLDIPGKTGLVLN
jgi:glycosidase